MLNTLDPLQEDHSVSVHSMSSVLIATLLAVAGINFIHQAFHRSKFERSSCLPHTLNGQ